MTFVVVRRGSGRGAVRLVEGVRERELRWLCTWLCALF